MNSHKPGFPKTFVLLSYRFFLLPQQCLEAFQVSAPISKPKSLSNVSQHTMG